MNYPERSDEYLNKIKVVNVVGARPNFMKIAPLYKLMKEVQEFNPILLHTGQHYDENMSKVFFDEMNIFYDENTMLVKSENFTFFTKLINGKFPDYQRIIPQDKKYELTLNRDKMIDHLKQVSTISQEMKLTFRNDAIVFESLNEENIEARTQLDFISNLTEDVVLAVNSKYILDFLTHIEKNEFKLRYNDSTLPFMLASDEFITVIMPIMI